MSGGNPEQPAARDRTHETTQGDMQRRYHISDEAHSGQGAQDATAALTDQVRISSY